MRSKLFKASEADDEFGSDGALDPSGYGPEGEDPDDGEDNTPPPEGNTPPDPDNPDETPSDDNLGNEMNDDDSMDENPDDDSTKYNPPSGPLNVDLVYRKTELKDNKKTNSKQYKQVDKLLDQRNNGKDPIALDIIVSKELKNDAKDTTDDLEDDEVTSDPDDLDSEQDIRLEYEDMSIENYIERFYYSVELGYTSDANIEFMGNVKNASSRAANAGITAAKATGRIAANVGGHAWSATKSGSSALKKGAVVVGGALAVAGIAATKKGIISLEKFWSKHEAHFNAIEKQLGQLRKEVYLKDEIVKKSSYTNSKVLSQILNHGVTNIHKQFSDQIKFRAEFTNIVLTTIMTQRTVTENLLRTVNNKEFRDLTLKDFIMKNTLENFFKPSHIEGSESSLVRTLESPQYLMANKVILSSVPQNKLSTIDEYIDAMGQSKSTIYHMPETSEFKIDYLDKKHLLDLIDLCLRFTRDLKNNRDSFNKMIGAKKTLVTTMDRFNILSKLDMFAKADKDTKQEVKSYLDVSTLYVDRVYVDAFLNMTNVYYNSLKYTIYFIKAHLTAKE